MADVVIVGGGHVGLYLASRLAEKGYQITLLEQKENIGERIVCTGIIGIEAFKQFDLPEDAIIGSIEKIRFFSPSGNYFDYLPPGVLARVVDRHKFNRYFAEQALGRSARIETGVHVGKIQIEKEGVTVTAVKGDGTEAIYNSQILILATGIQCKLFELAGLQAPKTFLAGAQVHIPFQGEDWTSIYTGGKTAPEAFGWVVPLETGVARVGLLCEKNPTEYLKKILDRIKPDWRDDTPESAIAIRPVAQGPLEKSFADRVLVVGEAAGQIKTTTGGGIYYGLLGANVACETVETAFKKSRFTAHILSSYDRGWKALIGDELRFGFYCRKFFAQLSDEQIEELFERMIREEILDLAYRSAQFDWHKSLILSIFGLPKIRRLLLNPF